MYQNGGIFVSSKVTRLSEGSEDQLSSAGDSPASLTVLQENVKHLVTTVTSGRNLKESFARLSPGGFWVKTSQDSVQVKMDGSLEEYCETWSRWGIILDGVAGELSILEPATGGNGYLLLPTVLANNLECRGKEYCGTRHAMKLHQAINLIPTCRSMESGNYQYANGDHRKPVATLTGKIAMLPTCTSWDHKDTGKMENVPVNALLGRELGKNHGMKLQPAFAEWMQGFPIGWTELNASEIRSVRSKSTRSSKRLQKLKTKRRSKV
jgi:hypothetical protein